VQDVTGGNVVPVFSGQLATLQSRALGNIAPGEVRTYRFTAWLPDGGAPPSPTSGDNAYAGSSMTARYSWTATAPDPGESGTGTGGGETGGDGGVVEPTLRFHVVSKRVLTRGVLDVMARCDRACRASAWAKLPKARGARSALTTRRRTVTITVPGKAARIRLKLSKKMKRQLQKMLRRRNKVAMRVTLSVVAASGGPAKTYSKKVVVKRPRRR
jgi:hypothetical protein